jgi:hypothetical protein
MFNKNSLPQYGGLSIVIATLGRDSLNQTIEYLNRGTIIPNEILICVPQIEAPKIKLFNYSNIRVIVTKCRGQVAQRTVGFQQAKEELIMQLDDDVFVRSDCIESMIRYMGNSQNISIGPKLFDAVSKKYYSFHFSSKSRKISIFNKFIFWVINGDQGYQPGRIGRAGVNMGFPEEGNWEDVDWLPGGCVLHRKKNLSLFYSYPFKGKAFAEDLYHSYSLRERGIKLSRCGHAECDVDNSSNLELNLLDFFKLYLANARSMSYFVKKIGGSQHYLYLYLFIYPIYKVINKFISYSK